MIFEGGRRGGRGIFKAQWRGGGKGILKPEKIIPEHDFSSSIAWSLRMKSQLKTNNEAIISLKESTKQIKNNVDSLSMDINTVKNKIDVKANEQIRRITRLEEKVQSSVESKFNIIDKEVGRSMIHVKQLTKRGSSLIN